MRPTPFSRLRFLLPVFLSVLCLLSLPASLRGQEARNRDDRPRWGGLVIQAFVPDPLPGGPVGGEFVQLLNRDVPYDLQGRDIGGWQLRLDGGVDFTFPAGTRVPAGGRLVVDFSGGVVAAKVKPEYYAAVLVAEKAPGQPYQNDFFSASATGAQRGLLALVRADGHIEDCVSWTDDPAWVASGALATQAYAEQEWFQGDAVLAGAWDETACSRRAPWAADGNRTMSPQHPWHPETWVNWMAGPPGLDHGWTGMENQVRGRVYQEDGSPLVGASVAIPALGLATTTDASGGWHLDGVPPGNHAVQVHAQGYAPRWIAALGKLPGCFLSVDATLVREDASSTTTATVGPAGGTVQGPGFELVFPPGFFGQDTTFRATYVPGGAASLVPGSRAFQPGPGGSILLRVALASVVVEPDLQSATPGLQATVKLRVPSPDALGLSLQPGDPVQADSVDAMGHAEAFPDGSITRDMAGTLWSVSRVPHCSAVVHSVPFRPEGGG